MLEERFDVEQNVVLFCDVGGDVSCSVQLMLEEMSDVGQNDVLFCDVKGDVRM